MAGKRPGAAVQTVQIDNTRIAGWLLVALLVPRIVRILYPQVWVEDDLLMESVYAVSKGFRPYLDFNHAQLPLLEWVAGFYVSVVGASHVRMELLNATAIYATSVLTFVVGQRAVGRRAAAAAALLFACSSLAFRYHVWAREFFVTALVLGAVSLAIDESRPAYKQVAGMAACLAAACAIKLTAAVSAVALLGFMALGLRRPGRAGLVAAGAVLGVGALAAFCYSQYGFPFVFQAFLFHFLKGRDAVGAGPGYPAQILDVLAPLLLLGLLAIWQMPRRNRAIAAVLTLAVALYGFYGVASPTAWGHNYLELLPFVAILAGAGAVWMVEASRTSWLRFGAGGALIAGCLIWVTPFWNENSERGAAYGFGFVPRRELAALADGLRAVTGPDDAVIAPSFIAFEANRMEFVRYPESLGVMEAAENEQITHGFFAARDLYGTRNFFDLINETSSVWNDLVISGLAVGGPVRAMIPDSPIQLLPLVNASPAALSQRGFQVRLQTEHYTLWTR